MKLLDDLFQIVQSETTEKGFSTTIKLNPDHVIYSGHFPGHPVTPGVIQMQIVHELVENHFGKNLQLIEIDDCKFLRIINPWERDEVQISVQYTADNGHLHVKATGKCDNGPVFKLKATYVII